MVICVLSKNIKLTMHFIALTDIDKDITVTNRITAKVFACREYL
jgi:hypothetical protein